VVTARQCKRECAWEAQRVDSAVDGYNDIIGKLYGPGLAKDEEGKLKAIEEMTKAMPHFFDVITKRLEANTCQKHLVGDKWTTADVCLANVFCSYVYNEAYPGHKQVNEIYDKYPVIKTYGEALKADLADYMASRPSPRPL